MKFESNLSNNDKNTIAIVLGIAAVFVVSWYFIRPQIMEIKSLNDDIEQAQLLETQYRSKIINLSSAESAYGRVVSDLKDSTDFYYEIMPSSSIDRMMTNYVLGFGLFPEELNIDMPEDSVEELPYIHSEAFDQLTTQIAATPTPTPAVTPVALGTTSSASTTPAPAVPEVESLFNPYSQALVASTTTETSGVQAADVTLVMSGSEAACQALIDDLCTMESIRVTGFEWLPIESTEQVNPETGEVEYVSSNTIRLRVNLRLYMAQIADYDAAVTEAVEAAGSEG